MIGRELGPQGAHACASEVREQRSHVVKVLIAGSGCFPFVLRDPLKVGVIDLFDCDRSRSFSPLNWKGPCSGEPRVWSVSTGGLKQRAQAVAVNQNSLILVFRAPFATQNISYCCIVR